MARCRGVLLSAVSGALGEVGLQRAPSILEAVTPFGAVSPGIPTLETWPRPLLPEARPRGRQGLLSLFFVFPEGV